MHMSEIDIPNHLGLILDGNRRWAKAQGLPTLEGHRAGAETFKEISLAAFDRGVNVVSAFIFSTENWKRTEEEVGYLMSLVMKAVDKYLDEFHERGIKIVILGRSEGVRSKVLEAIRKTEQKTKDNTKGTLALCFNYGGRAEIVDACKEVVNAGVNPDDIDEDLLSKHMYGGDAVPDVDLVIRTSGEQRSSGFMLYRAAYAEYMFLDKYWPDIAVSDLEDALKNYAERSRRFGK